MTFPTIPTTGAGRLVGLNQLNTTATLTGPNLNTLTKSAGDLLIAVAGEYQSNAGADAAYTGWAGGGLVWTEIRDSTGTAVNRLGVAYARVVTGSETGTVTVTRSGTLVGDASMIVMCIPGAHASTAPEATVMATAANANPGAAPAALDPAGWGTEDTLWIGVNGSGMTNASGTWTGNNGPPTNYTDYFGTTPADTSTIGDFGLAVAFRQLNASSETMAGFDVDSSNNRTSALLIAVRPVPAPLTGAATGTVTWVGSATGARVSAGSATGSVAWVGSAAGSRTSRGAASGAVAWSGSATGEAPAAAANSGAATGTVTWAGSATGARASAGAATGAVAWVGAATGARTSSGAATGAVTWVGAATGTRTPKAAATGTVSWVASATGATVRRGAATGTITWAGSATGTAPLVIQDGSAAGAITWAGAATGARTSSGSASGSLAYVGTTTGTRTPKASASGSTIYVGAASGQRTPKASASGAATWVGAATGEAPGSSLPDVNPITLTIRDRGHTATVESPRAFTTSRTPRAHVTTEPEPTSATVRQNA